MILTMFPVPPPPVRPSILMDTTTRGEDDLTHKLSDIIKVYSSYINWSCSDTSLKANGNLKRQEQNGAQAHIINEFAQLLQVHIATYVDNELPGQPQVLLFSSRSKP